METMTKEYKEILTAYLAEKNDSQTLAAAIVVVASGHFKNNIQATLGWLEGIGLLELSDLKEDLPN